jgi:hypothetical protein
MRVKEINTMHRPVSAMMADAVEQASVTAVVAVVDLLLYL